MNKKIEEAMHKYLAKSNPPKTVYVHTNDLLFNAKILYDLGYITKEIYDKLYKYCLYHDIGKCNDIMNNRLNAAIKGTRINFDENLEVPHNILSFEMLDENDFEDKEEYYRTSYIVLNHHAHIDNNEYITNPLNDELLKKTLEQYNLVPRSKKQIRQYHRYIEDNLTKDIIFEKGLLHKCDYSASGETTIEYKNDFLENSMDNMYSKNGFIPNELQTFTRNNRNKNLCIVAQTGMGKTEASLLWGGNNKIVYFLPLRASINAIFDRIKTQVLDNDIKEKLGILHSNALEKLGINESIDEEYDFLRHYNESKNLCLPLSISTIDQLFTFVYRYPTYEINVANLAMSKIIIDEIQGFDAKLFADLVAGDFAVINANDQYTENFLEVISPTVDKYTYGVTNNADVMAKDISFSGNGASFTCVVRGKEYKTNLAMNGMFSVYNVLAAITVALALNFDIEKSIKVLEEIPGVAGRFEVVTTKPTVIVDYAHTPDGLENVLKAAKEITPKDGKLICIFGCGGDRDATKRPKMGAIAEKLADKVIITSDNPRSENPQQIITDILAGFKSTAEVIVEPNRELAIKEAYKIAQPNDVVLVAGKGHEDYQILAEETIHFDDREKVREIFG